MYLVTFYHWGKNVWLKQRKWILQSTWDDDDDDGTHSLPGEDSWCWRLMFLRGKTKGSSAHRTGSTARLVSCRRAPPSVHQQHLAISDTLGGEAEQTVSCCRIHLARKRGEGEGFFPSLVSQRLYRPPLTALGSPRRGCAAVCRMSRHEGELINRSTAPGLVATLPEQLAPLASFAKCLFKSVGGVLRFSRLVSRLVPTYAHFQSAALVYTHRWCPLIWGKTLKLL